VSDGGWTPAGEDTVTGAGGDAVGGGDPVGGGDAVAEVPAPEPVDLRAAASVAAAPMQVAPGDVANTTISVTNLRREPCSFALSLSGLDPAWYGLPERVGPLAPGERVDVPFHLSLPRGYPPCSLLLAVEARPLPGGDVVPGVVRRALPGRATSPSAPGDGYPATNGHGTNGQGTNGQGHGARTPRAGDERRNPGRHDLRVLVGDGASIAARLDPTDIVGGRRGRFDLVLRNRGSQSQQVRLAPVSPDQHLEVEFRPDTPLLLPGREVKVAARVRTRQPVRGEPQRRPFAVRVQGRGTPVMAEGSYTVRPLMPRWAFKSVAILLVAALWISVAALGIHLLSKHLHQSALNNLQLSHHPHHPKTTGKTTTSRPGSKTTGSSPSSSPGSSSSSTPGSSTGSSAPGSKKTGTAKKGAPGSAPSSAHTVEVTGKVGGASPGGVTVTLSPTSLVSPQVLGAGNGSTGTLASSVHRLRHRGATGSDAGALLTAAVRRRTPGSATSAVPSHPARAATSPVLVRAGHRAQPLPDGKVYGTEAAAAFFPSLVAAVTPTLTTTTLADGSFVFTGVPAPGTYLVSFTEPGYNTRKYVVQTSTGKNVTLDTALSPGTGSLSGTVTGPSGPLGGVSITVSDGSVTVTTVTPTTGAGIGTWSVSGLNTPDTYLVSASAPGYGTQITSASLAASASLAGVDLKMTPGVGSISGTVTSGTSGQPVGGVTVTATDGSASATATTSTVSPVGTYTLPDLAIPGTWTVAVSGPGWITQTQLVKLDGNATVNASLTSSGANVVGVVKSGGSGLANVGLTLSNQNATFKTLSESVSPVGGFDFGQIPPGQYVLSASAFGYTTQSASVSVSAGQTQTVDLTLPFVGTSTLKTGTITGSVVNEFSGTPLATIPMDLDGKPTTDKTNSSGVYTISGVAPGLHEVTALGTALTFAKAGVQVSVAQGATATAPVIELPHLSTIKGVVTSQLTGKRISGAKVLLFAAGKKLATSPTPTAQTTSTSSGTYALTHVAAGNYVLEATREATGYNEAQVDVSVPAGVTPVVQNISLTEGPTYQAKTWKVTSGHLVPLAYVCVLVTGPTGTPHTAAAITSPTDNEVTISNLKAGKTYQATFRLPTPPITTTAKTSTCPKPAATTGFSYSAPRESFVAKTDNTTIYSAVLAPVNEGITVNLEFPFVEAGSGTIEDCPVTTSPQGTCAAAELKTSTLPTVTLVGTTSYGTTRSGTPGGPVTTTVQMTHTANSNTWSYTATGSSTRFYGTTVTLRVTDPAGQFAQLTTSIALSGSGTATVTELLSPVPVHVTGTITPTSGLSISVKPSVLHPTKTTNTLTSTDDITASEGTGGTLTWTDPAVRRAGYAQPGKYTLTLAAPQYATKTTPVTVPLCGTACVVTVGSISLSQLVTLTVTASNVPATFTPPTVSVYEGSGTTDKIAQKPLVKTGSMFTVTFTRLLTPTVTDYRFTVSGQGIESYTSAKHTPIDPRHAHTDVLSVLAALTEDAWLTGTVTGILVPATPSSSSPGASQALATAAVAANFVTGTPPIGSSCVKSFSTRSRSTGSYTLIPSIGGLCPTSTYAITVTAHGFTTKSTTKKLTRGATPASFTLVATKVTQALDVKTVANNVVVKVTASSAVGPTISCTFTVGTKTNYSKTTPKSCTSATAYTGGATGVVFAFSIYPTSYNYSISAYQYESVTIGVPAPSPGINPTPQSYSMTQPNVTIEGTVKVSATGNTSGAKVIATLPLTLYTSAGTSKVANIAQQKTTATGTFTFANVPPGNYLIKIGDYYTTLSAVQISTGTQTLVRKTFVVYAPGKQVTIAVKGSSAKSASVHLTPTSHAVPVVCGSTSALLATGLGTVQTTMVRSTTATPSDAVFTNVVPDVYTVSMGTAPSSTVLTLTVCPAPLTQPTAVTTPTAPTVTLPTVTVTGSPSLTYGSETSSSFVVKVMGAGGHGYPEGNVALTVSGAPKTLACTQSGNGTTSTYTCRLTSSTEVGVGMYTVRYEPVIPSSSVATYFYGPAKSKTAVAVKATVPLAPTNLKETAKTSTTVTLAWTAPSTTGGTPITHYLVFKTSSLYATLGATALTDQVTGLTAGTTYNFTVKAENGVGTSPASTSLSVTTPTVPSTPTNLRETAKTSTTVTLAWTAPSTTGGTPITHYLVYKTSSLYATLGATALTDQVTGLTAGTTYNFTVKAENGVGTSGAPKTLSVTTT